MIYDTLDRGQHRHMCHGIRVKTDTQHNCKNVGHVLSTYLYFSNAMKLIWSWIAQINLRKLLNYSVYN